MPTSSSSSPKLGLERELEASAGPTSAPAQDVDHVRAALRAALKVLLVAELNLVGRDGASIADDAPLFTREQGGLGLDSLDALQIAMLVEERFAVRVPEGDEARPIFASVATLADFIVGAGGALRP
jgi:acyl carrier protein